MKEVMKTALLTLFLPLAFIVVLATFSALVLGTTSMAFAANGKPFVLGKVNVASAFSTLKKQGPGPALRLVVAPGQPPLWVNSDARVASLNADKVDGFGSTDFQRSGAAAGGDLTGSYPDPRLAPDSVGSDEITTQAVGTEEIDSSQVQRRVSGFCSAGTAVRFIEPNGTIVCGSSGPTGLEKLTASSAYNDVRLKSVDAQCPSGKVALSGGGEYSNVPTGIAAGFSDDVALYNNGPVANSTSMQQWRVGARWLGEGTPPEWRVIAYVVCANR